MTKTAYSHMISPKQFGQVIGMSESSLKRWIDSGHLQVTRTVGGHRRISIKEALRFIRSRSLKVRDSSLLKISVNTDSLSGDDCSSLFLHYLKKGMTEEASQLLFNEFIKGATIAELGDGPIKSALQIIALEGDSPNIILMEHRATQLCIQIINSLQELAVQEKTFFHAVGGAVSGDIYALPSALVAAVLEENHGTTINLGPNTPISVFREASVLLDQSKKPNLVWISISELKNPKELSKELSRFAQECYENKIELIVGGRSVGKLTLEHKPNLTLHASLKSISKQVTAFQKQI
jgi:MerR family transcriptional regulator, light-induced transcriptional regulator